MIIGLIVEGHTDRYLDSAIQRAWSWADKVIHAPGPPAAAWKTLEDSSPAIGDHVLVLRGDEIVHDYQMVKRAVDLWPNYRLGFIVYHMWNENHYRDNGPFGPRLDFRLTPYRPGARWDVQTTDDQMLPGYVRSISPITKEVGKILSYRYAQPADRTWEHEQLLRTKPLDAQQLNTYPVLRQWDLGGTLVGEA